MQSWLGWKWVTEFSGVGACIPNTKHAPERAPHAHLPPEITVTVSERMVHVCTRNMHQNMHHTKKVI